MAFDKRALVGHPPATTKIDGEGIPKRLGVFSANALSSTAYATEGILFVTAAGTSSLALGLDALVPVGIAVAVLLAIVVTSYRQTCFAYPGGGGSYVVSRENLGENPSLVAGASLLVDSVLTVAVSISAGVAAIVSIPELRDLEEHRVLLALALIGLISVVNLRGIKESGRLFAVPTYAYIFALLALVGYGLYRALVADDIEPIALGKDFVADNVTGGTLGLFVLLKGFSSGAVALTGVDAISNRVPAFRRPESKNAANTLLVTGLILGSLFMGVQVLADHVGPYPSERITVMSQLGGAVWGTGTFMYDVLQIATAGILLLAANTAFANFPRLSSIVARDGYLPRQLANRGDRLVFSNGVLVLALSAAVLVVAFGGITSSLIPLYVVSAFLSFTLAQAGMMRHHRKVHAQGYKRNVAINAVGSVGTLIVLVVMGTTKFTSGAWVPIVAIVMIVLLFKSIKRHYKTVANGLRVTPDHRARKMNHTVVVLVSGVHRGVLEALAYAKSLSPNQLVAVSVVSDEEDQEDLERAWEEFGIETPLETVYSPYRELTGPVLTYIDELDARWENDIVTVVLPEFVIRHWWGNLLHGQSALLLKGRLLFRKGTVVTSLPYHLE